MQIRVETRSPQSLVESGQKAREQAGKSVRQEQMAQWREQVERRVRFVLRRLRTQVQQVHVRLEDINGPRGGNDMRCQISIVTEGHGTVVTHATRVSAWPALDAALKRTTDALVKLWQRQRHHGRDSLRLATPESNEESRQRSGAEAGPEAQPVLQGT